jgi:hypothetical protein
VLVFRICAIDFLDALGESEKEAREKVADSYRRKLGRGAVGKQR